MNNTETIGRFGTEWQKYMKENHPNVIMTDLVGNRFDELARKIDAEAWEMWELLRRQYAEKYPRPKIFTEIVVWEKTRSLYVEHEVMEQVVLRCSFYEDIVQIGDKDATGTGTADAEIAAKCLIEYMEGFSERNPNFFVFNAVLHMDEATPHLHIDYIPIGHYKRWVDTQNGLAQALKEMGYGEGENTINRWQLAERDVLAGICRKHGIEIAETQKSRGYTYTVEQYKQHRDTIAAFEQQEAELSENLEELKLLNDAAENEGIESTKLPFNKRVVAEEEFQKLEAAKKTAAIRKTTLDSREKDIAEKENAITQKEIELSEMIIDAERSYHKYNELADELLDDSRAYHQLLPKHKALEERYQRAESELSETKGSIISAVKHITDIAKLSNCMLAPITGYEDLAEKAAPLHKTLANVIRRLCSRFVRSLGFDKEADIISKKAGISDEALSEFKSIENPAQSKRFVR